MTRAERSYLRLLNVLPAAFRREAGAELLEVFRDDRARSHGGVRFWLRVLLDLVVTALHEWRAALGRRSLPPKRRVHTRGGDPMRQFATALRALRRSPSRTAVASITLGLGIAATVVGVVLVRALLLSPLPFPEADRLVRLIELDERGGTWWPSYPNIADWRQYGTRVFKGVGAADIPQPRPVIWDGQAQRLAVGGYTRGLLETLGVRPAVGRDFTAAENAPGGAPVALVSWNLWQGRLGGRELSEAALTIGSEQYAVIGVLPRDFRFFGDRAAWSDADVFLAMERNPNLGGRTSHGYHAVGRIRSGLSHEQAAVTMNDLARELRERHGEPTQAHTVRMTPVLDDVVGAIREPLRMLLGAALLVLIVACLNVGGTLLASGVARERELSVRMAIGARRRDLLAQLLAEAAALALPGALVGASLSLLTLRWIRALPPGVLPRLENIRADAGTLGLTLAVAIGAALLAGIVPAFMLSARGTAQRLRGSMGMTAVRRTQRLWSGFIALQAALTLVMLFGGALLGRSLLQLLSVRTGFDATGVLAVGVSLPELRYANEAHRPLFYQALLERVRALPSVEAAGIGNLLPHEVWARTASTEWPGVESGSLFAAYRTVDAGYFEALTIPTVRGRGPAAGALAPGEAWIDEALARKVESAGEVIGGRVRNNFQETPATVIGTVGAVGTWQLTEGMPTVYVDYRTRPDLLLEMSLLVRTRGDLDTVAGAVRELVRTQDPMVPIETRPLAGYLADETAARRLLLGLLGGFALVALALAAVAVYSMVSFVVGRRRRELGIRMSLGARPHQVVRHAMQDGVGPAFAGLLVGALVALALGTVLQSQLYGVRPRDPLALAFACTLLALAAALASLLPARAAAAVDPASVLRSD